MLSFITHPVQDRIFPWADVLLFFWINLFYFMHLQTLKTQVSLWNPWSLISVFGFLIISSINTLSYYIEKFLEDRLRTFNAYSFDSYWQLALLDSAKEGTSSQRKAVPDTKVSWSACNLNVHAIAFRIPPSLCRLVAVNCLYVHRFSVCFF